MGHINAVIKSVKQIFKDMGSTLQIPPYQRPYRWEYKNDIATNKNAGKQKYRIGSVICLSNILEIENDGQNTLT